MSTIITTEQLESLQNDLVRVLNVEREHHHEVQIIVIPAPDANGTHATRRATVVPIDPMDDLQLATWEDAEWR